MPQGFYEGFTFTEQCCPPELLARVSRAHFTISRATKFHGENLSPAVLEVLSKFKQRRSFSVNCIIFFCTGLSGVYVNNCFVPHKSSIILRSGNIIHLMPGPQMMLFQFTDLRDFHDQNVIREIKRKYHVDENVGKGGQSTVRLLHNRVTLGKLAMKTVGLLQSIGESNNRYQKRIQHVHNEVHVMQTMAHVNIIKFVEAFKTTFNMFILMEYAEQGNLLDYMRKFQHLCLPEDEAKFCIYQVCKGLDHLHNHKIAHRDLKVENVFVSKRQVGSRNEVLLKIGDFGYSKYVDQHLNTQVGTWCYFPPEILKHEEYSISADIWTLGCMLFACLSGSFPFHENYSHLSVQQQILEAKFSFDKNSNWRKVSNFYLENDGKFILCFFLGLQWCETIDQENDSGQSSSTATHRRNPEG